MEGLAPVARVLREALRRYRSRLDRQDERDDLERAVHDLAERAVRLVATAKRVGSTVNGLVGADGPLGTDALNTLGVRLGLVEDGTPLDAGTLEWLVDAVDLARELVTDGATVTLDAVTTALAVMRLLRPEAEAALAAQLAARIRADLDDLTAMLHDVHPDTAADGRTVVKQLADRLRELGTRPVDQRLRGLRTLARDVAGRRADLTAGLRVPFWPAVEGWGRYVHTEWSGIAGLIRSVWSTCADERTLDVMSMLLTGIAAIDEPLRDW